jgi:HK97 family phage major capsid protein
MDAEQIKSITQGVESIGKKMDEELAAIKTAIGDLQAKGAVGEAGRTLDPEVKSMIDYMRGAEMKTGTVANPTTGGYAAVPSFVSEVVAKYYQENPLLSEITINRIDGNVAVVPVEKGAPNVSWVGETEARSGDVGKLGVANIPMNECIACVPLSNVLINDSNLFNVEQYMADSASKALSREIGKTIISGSGFKQPEGVLTAPGVTPVASGNASKLTTDALFDMVGALPDEAVPGAKWLMSSSTFWNVAKTFGKDSSYVTMPLAAGIQPAILGHSVIIADMPSVQANAFPIVFGNFKDGYRGIEHEGLTYLRDPYTGIANGITKTWFSSRFGGQVVNPESFVKMKVAASI